MYNRAPREGLPKNGDTPDHVGPTTYYPEEDKSQKQNSVPFLSSMERNMALFQIENENFYWRDTPEHVKGGSSIKNRVPRFICSDVDIPGPCDYDPQIPSGQKSKEIRPPGRGKLYLCNVPRSDYVHGPSIPTESDGNGYEIRNGKLIKLQPIKHDISLGPAFYDVPITDPCFNTKKYKGCEWSKRRSRSRTKTSSSPGPGSYNLESDFGKIDLRYADIREMARRDSYAPRTTEANEERLRKENVPGPGHYDINSSSLRQTKWMGIKPAPFVNSTPRFSSSESDTPSPDTYLIKSLMDAKKRSLRQSGFRANNHRFCKNMTMFTPNPSKYNTQSGIFKENIITKSFYAPFNTAEPRHIEFIRNDDTPGPTEYFLDFPNDNLYRVKGCRIVSNTSRFPEIKAAGYVDPATYDISEQFNKNRDPTSHNHQEVPFQSKVERQLFSPKFDTPDPCKYTGHKNFGTNTMAFARTPRFKEPKEMSPGPATYTLSGFSCDSMYKATDTHNLNLKENALRTKLRLSPAQTWLAWHEELNKNKKLAFLFQETKDD